MKTLEDVARTLSPTATRLDRRWAVRELLSTDLASYSDRAIAAALDIPRYDVRALRRSSANGARATRRGRDGKVYAPRIPDVTTPTTCLDMTPPVLPPLAPSMRLLLGDSLDLLRDMDSASVDACITDPPYNVGLKYSSWNDSRPDYEQWCRAWFAQLERVCRGQILITPGMVNLAMWFEIKKPRWVLCWHKPASGTRSAVGFNNWEPILVYGPKMPKRDHCDFFRTTEQAGWGRKMRTNAHPCPKPVEWATKQIEMVTKPDAIVLDPFAGSGTTGVGCLRTGRRFVGCEIDPGYLAIADRRIREAQAVAA